jgi:hypothetical protein
MGMFMYGNAFPLSIGTTKKGREPRVSKPTTLAAPYRSKGGSVGRGLFDWLGGEHSMDALVLLNRVIPSRSDFVLRFRSLHCSFRGVASFFHERDIEEDEEVKKTYR